MRWISAVVFRSEPTVTGNDTTLADLIGQTAHVRVWTTAPGCRLMAETDVKLTAGGYMGADAGIWGEVSP